MFWNRFYSLCIQKGIKPNPLGSKIGISSGVITKWKNGTIPNGDTLIKIADYLGCSVDYLLGRTDDPGQFSDDKKKPIPFMGSANPGSAQRMAESHGPAIVMGHGGPGGQRRIGAPRKQLLELYDILNDMTDQQLKVVADLAKNLKDMDKKGK